MMNYSFEINQKSKTIDVVTSGDLKTKDTVKMGLIILLKAKELKFKIMFDTRLSNNKISFGEAYCWFSTHFDEIDAEFRKIPTAYIGKDADWDFYSFFELTCSNKGIPIKAFHEKNTAIEWLQSL